MPDVALSTKQTALFTALTAIGIGFAAGFIFSLVRPRRGTPL